MFLKFRKFKRIPNYIRMYSQLKNLPMVLSAVLYKDSTDPAELTETLLEESREQIKRFEIESDDSEDEI